MFRALGQDQARASRNPGLEEFLEFRAGDSSTHIQKLYLDTIREGLGPANERIYFKYQQEFSYNFRSDTSHECLPASEEGSVLGKCGISGEDMNYKSFLGFLVRRGFSRDSLAKLARYYDQSMISAAEMILQYPFLQSYDDGVFAPPKVQTKSRKEVDIYETEQGDLLIDVKNSHFFINIVNISDPDNPILTSPIPGTISTRYKFENGQFVLDKIVVDNALLHQFCLGGKVIFSEDDRSDNADILLTDKTIRQAEKESQLVRDKEIALSNSLYDLDQFCAEIQTNSPEDYTVARELHTFLTEKHAELFECARFKPEECPRVIREIKARLATADKQLRKYPNWKGIAKNIAVAVTGVGAIVMVVKAFVSLAKDGKFDPRLFSTTAKPIAAIQAHVDSIRVAPAAV